MGEGKTVANPAGGGSTLEDLRLEVLRAMQETRQQQEEAVRAFVANAGRVMSQLNMQTERPEANALSLLGAAREDFSHAAEIVADQASAALEALSPKEAVNRAAEEALAAVAATERAPGDS